MMHEWIGRLTRWFTRAPEMPESPKDPDKQELARRLQDAESRLRFLEWQADVIRRQDGTSQKDR